MQNLRWRQALEDVTFFLSNQKLKFGSYKSLSEDMFGFIWEHAVHCKELSSFKYQHDMVRDVLFDVCRHVGIFSRKEAPVNFLTDVLDGRSTLTPADPF
ncbi:hypothetical protein Tco_1320664 [Tanacetum coccineum]